MPAWTKQVVPLVFLETCVSAFGAEAGEHQVFQEIEAGFSACWEHVRREYNVDARRVARASESVQALLVRRWEAEPDTAEITHTLLAVAARVEEQVPARMRPAWGRLHVALFALSEMVDPNLERRVDRAAETADELWRVALEDY